SAIREGHLSRDRHDIQSLWTMVREVHSGTPSEDGALKTWRLLVTNEKMIVFFSDWEGYSWITPFKRNESRHPPQIELAYPIGERTPRICRGIYELNGDTLKICLSLRLNGKRPTAFVSEIGSDTRLWLLKRDSEGETA